MTSEWRISKILFCIWKSRRYHRHSTSTHDRKSSSTLIYLFKWMGFLSLHVLLLFVSERRIANVRSSCYFWRTNFDSVMIWMICIVNGECISWHAKLHWKCDGGGVGNGSCSGDVAIACHWIHFQFYRRAFGSLASVKKRNWKKKLKRETLNAIRCLCRCLHTQNAKSTCVAGEWNGMTLVSAFVWACLLLLHLQSKLLNDKNVHLPCSLLDAHSLSLSVTPDARWRT